MIRWLLRRPDLSLSYADPAIADRQRKLVSRQLEAMRKGDPPEHFEMVGRFLSGLRTQTNLNCITLLDAGCGSAYYSEIINYFVPCWIEYVGADFNPGMLDLARFYYPKLALIRMDVRNLGFQDRSFEMVMSGAVGGTYQRVENRFKGIRQGRKKVGSASQNPSYQRAHYHRIGRASLPEECISRTH